MAYDLPNSMDECLFFTNRTLGDGKITAWVERKKCPECGKGKMGKPLNKDGGVKTRATVYQCHECGYEEEKKAHEESCEIKANYICPDCGKEGSSTGQYKRKKFQGVDAFVLECEHCGGKLPVTKKLKDPKKKKK